MNNVLKALKVEKNYENPEDAYEDLKANGFDLSKNTPATLNTGFGYDLVNKEMGLYDLKEHKVLFAPSVEKGTAFYDNVFFFVTKGDDFVSYGINYIYNDLVFDEDISVDSIGTIKVKDGKRVYGNITFNSEEEVNATIEGTFIGNLTFNTPKAHIEQYGYVEGTIDAQKVSSSTLVIDGYVSYLKIGEGSIEITKNGIIREIINTAPLAIGEGNTFVNKGYIAYVPKAVSNISTIVANYGFIGLQYSSEDTTNKSLKDSSYNPSLNIEISNAFDLLKFSTMTQHKDSPFIYHETANDYNIVNVELLCDIDLSECVFIPISAWYNGASMGWAYGQKQYDSSYSVSKGSIFTGIHISFDGKDHTIKNVKENLFGTLCAGSTIKNLTLEWNLNSIDGNDTKNAIDCIFVDGYKNYDQGKITSVDFDGGEMCVFGLLAQGVYFEKDVEDNKDVNITNVKITGICKMGNVNHLNNGAFIGKFVGELCNTQNSKKNIIIYKDCEFTCEAKIVYQDMTTYTINSDTADNS